MGVPKRIKKSKGTCKFCKKIKLVSKMNECDKCHREHTITYWRDKLWETLKKYVKERDHYTCVTCWKQVEGSNCQAGHFFTGASCPVSVYFDEENVHVQCYRCNISLSGNWPEYYKFMLRKYGQETIDKLWRMKDHLKGERWEIPEYKTKIEYYEKKYAILHHS